MIAHEYYNEALTTGQISNGLLIIVNNICEGFVITSANLHTRLTVRPTNETKQDSMYLLELIVKGAVSWEIS